MFKYIRSVIGLESYQFEELFKDVLKLYVKPQRGPEKSVPLKWRLTFYLVHLKTSISFRFFSWLYFVSISTLHEYFDEIHGYLLQTLGEPSIPTLSERLKSSVEFYGKKASIVVDGVEQEIYSSIDNGISKVTFSGKKGYHTFTKLLFVNPHGKIYLVTDSQPGSMNDLNLLTMCDTWKKLNLSDEEIIMADDGFRGYAEHKVITLSTETSVSGDENYHKQFKRIRVVVENAISHVKKWRICSTLFRAKVKNLTEALEKHHKIWLVCVGLVNRFVQIRADE